MRRPGKNQLFDNLYNITKMWEQLSEIQNKVILKPSGVVETSQKIQKFKTAKGTNKQETNSRRTATPEYAANGETGRDQLRQGYDRVLAPRESAC